MIVNKEKMKKAWFVVSNKISMVLIVFVIWTQQNLNQVSNNYSHWERVVKHFNDEQIIGPPKKRCPFCPRGYIILYSKHGQLDDSTIINKMVKNMMNNKYKFIEINLKVH